MTSSTVRFDGTSIEPSLVGGKGYALNRLIAMDAPVLPTGAITTEGYDWFVRDSGLVPFVEALQHAEMF